MHWCQSYHLYKACCNGIRKKSLSTLNLWDAHQQRIPMVEWQSIGTNRTIGTNGRGECTPTQPEATGKYLVAIIDKLIERYPLIACIEIIEKYFANLFDGLVFLRLHFIIILFHQFSCKNASGWSVIAWKTCRHDATKWQFYRFSMKEDRLVSGVRG